MRCLCGSEYLIVEGSLDELTRSGDRRRRDTDRGDFSLGGPAPLSQSPFLSDVVEPITIVFTMSFDDGGSQGLRFADARGTVRNVCLENTLVWADEPKVQEGHHNILLNSFYPHGDQAQRVPISGVEERALLGLLERWASRDPDAMELERRYRRYNAREISMDAFWEGLSDRHHLIQTAVSILFTLRARN